MKKQQQQQVPIVEHRKTKILLQTQDKDDFRLAKKNTTL